MSAVPRILYVDDDADNCEMLKYWIRKECGYDIAIAMDGKHAIELIEAESFDLFLLDYCLPDTTGLELCRQIRKFYPHVPVAVYSALDREVDKQNALDAGANAYLVKPEELDQIKPFLEKYLSAKPSTPPEPEPSTKGLQRGRMRGLGIL